MPAEGSGATGNGTCTWCSLPVRYIDPAPTGDTDAAAALNTYYDGTWAAWHDWTLIDSTGSTHCTGAGALSQPGVAIGQLPIHQLAAPQVIQGSAGLAGHS